MKKIALSLMTVLALLVFTVANVVATSGDNGWSRTTTEGATGFFTITHTTNLVTEGSVQVTRLIRSSSATGAQIQDIASVEGKLTRCEEYGCQTVWSFKGKKDISDSNWLQISQGSIGLEAVLPVTIEVRDFDDTDGDGDRNEPVTSFTANTPITANWTWEAANTCGEVGDAAGTAISEETVQPALFSGILAGRALTTVSAKTIQSDTIYGKSPGGSCA